MNEPRGRALVETSGLAGMTILFSEYLTICIEVRMLVTTVDEASLGRIVKPEVARNASTLRRTHPP